MATVSRAYIEQFAAQNKIITDAMGRQLVSVLAGIDTSERETIRSLVYMVLKPYTNIAASLAAQFYNGIRQASNPPSEYEASAMGGFDRVYLNQQIDDVLDKVDEGRNTAPRDKLLVDVGGKFVKDASDNSIRLNARKDPAKPKYAIVPNSDACAFCVMRASLGYHYPEKAAIRSHHDCACVATPVFRGAKIEGYDPKTYLDQYEQAAKALASGDLPQDLKDHLEAEKAAKGGEFNRTKQILAVMRYQQGIN